MPTRLNKWHVRISQKGLRLLILGCMGLVFAQKAYADCPPTCPFFVQPIMFDPGTGKYVGVGDGPFTTMFPGGVAPDDPDFSGARLSPEMFKERDFGSIGAAKGGSFKNLTKKDVGDIEITGKKGNNFTGSQGGGGWDVTIGMDANGNPTLTLMAQAGKELKPGETLWLKIPEAPQPGDPATPPIFSGRLTPPMAAPEPAPKTETPPSVKSGGDKTPDQNPRLGPGGFNLVPSVSFDSNAKMLTFSLADVTTALYLDGSIATANSASESIIGSLITIGLMDFLGPSVDIPGGFLFGDSGLQITQGDTIFLTATLTDILLLPSGVEAGFDSRLQATLVWDQVNLGLGSRYLQEYLDVSEVSALFFQSNLLGVTNGMTQSGSAAGTVDICSTAEIPEPTTWILVCSGIVTLVKYRLSRKLPLS